MPPSLLGKGGKPQFILIRCSSFLVFRCEHTFLSCPWFLAALDLSAPSQDNKLETSAPLKKKGMCCGRQVLSILLIQKEKEREKKDVIQLYSKLRCRSLLNLHIRKLRLERPPGWLLSHQSWYMGSQGWDIGQCKTITYLKTNQQTCSLAGP